MKAQIFNYTGWIQLLGVDYENKLDQFYKNILIESGFSVLSIVDHHFNPAGYTALFLLAESHLAIHTFPEEKIYYIELSSCNIDYYNNFIFVLKKLNIKLIEHK